MHPQSRYFFAVGLLSLAVLITGAAAQEESAKQVSKTSSESPKQSDSADDQLAKRDQRLAKSIAPIYRAGDWERLLGIVRKSLSRRSVEDVWNLDEYLKKASGTSLSAMVWRSRKRLSQSGAKSPPPLALEALLMAKQLAKSLDDEIKQLRELKIMAVPLEDPHDFIQYRDLVWEHHVHSNEVRNLQKLAAQGVQMSRRITEARKTKQDQAAREELAKFDFGEYSARLKKLKKELDERALEVRVNRVRHAVEVLEDDAAGVTDRFFAAYVVGVDSESLVEAIRKARSFDRPILSEPQLAQKLTADLNRGQKSAGDLVEKSRLLFAGLHWWRRGRYGMGTEAFGLLKSKAAMSDPRLRTALMMPKTTPIPTNPRSATKQSVPNYQRRHLYIWAYEDRSFTSTTTSSNSYSTESSGTNSPLKNKHFDGMIGDKFW